MCLLLYQPIVKTPPTLHGSDPVDMMFLLLKASSVSARVETRTAKVSQGQVGLLSLHFFSSKLREQMLPS